MSDPFDPSISLTVRRASARAALTRPPGLCLVGIDPGDACPGLTPARQVGDDAEGARLYRMQPGAPLGALPGLEHDSRLRDAVDLALGAGAGAVDVVLARGPGLGPRDWAARSLALCEPLLDEQTRSVLVFPDLVLGGVLPALAALRRELQARQQILLLDVPSQPVEAERALAELLEQGESLDAALVGWQGAGLALRQHQWRSAAALLGGALASREPALSVVGLPIALARGRPPLCPQAAMLDLARADLAPPAGAQHVAQLAIDADGRTATLRGDPTLRRPLGAWSLAAMRSAKTVLRLLTDAARGFLFHAARTSEASALAAALQASVSDWTAKGLLVGDDGGRPRFHGGVSTDPARPGIHANMRAWLQPWTRRLDIDVRLMPGEPATIVELQ